MNGDEIDSQILSDVNDQWQKVAMVIGRIMDRFPDAEESDIAARIEQLVKWGHLEAAGNLRNFRHSEIRKSLSGAMKQSGKPHLSIVKNGRATSPPADNAELPPTSLHRHNEKLIREHAVQKEMIKRLVQLGTERGYLTRAEISELLPDVVDDGQLASIAETFADMGIALR